jgi:pilus assembly protein CpaB
MKGNLYMIKLRSIIFLVLALFFGLVASRQISKYIEYRVQKEKDAAKVENIIPTQNVVVASEDIVWGTRLTNEQLKVTLWPTDCVPESAFSETDVLIGRAVKTVLAKGEPILEPKLAPEGFKGGMTGIIPDGKRAITIKVNEVAGVAGFVLPGSKVDIILTVDIKEKGSQDKSSVSKMLLQNMLVLAVDQKMSQDEENPVIVNAVTLLVSPEETEKLALSNSKGKLQLAMRNGMDSALVATSGIFCIGELLEMGNNEVAHASSLKFEVEIIKGTQRSQITFDMPRQPITEAKETFEM